MSITVTPAAAQRIRHFLTQRGKGVGLRLAVKTSGCSGLAYALEFADEMTLDDLQFESEGVIILTDQKSHEFLAGTELDFVREGLNEGFRFNNPNVKDQCGCGESFRV